MKDAPCLLFDCDGTLIDTYDIILTSMRHTVNGLLGQNRTDEELMAGVGTPLLDQMMHFLDGDEERAAEVVELYREHNDAIHDEGVRSFPGVAETLEELRAAGCRMGVITSKRHYMADRGLEICGIRQFFEVLIGSDDFPEHKPEPGPILEACRIMGTEPAKSIYVGDSPYDIIAGNAAGCETIAALWGMFPEDVLRQEHPTFEAKAFSDIPAILGM